MGLIDLIHRIEELWSSEERHKVVDQAEKIVEMFSQNIHTNGKIFPSQNRSQMLLNCSIKWPIRFMEELKGLQNSLSAISTAS